MKLFVTLLILMVLSAALYGETFDERLKRLGEETAKGYVRPLVTSFGSNLNTNLYNSAEVMKPSLLRPIRFGFNFYTMLALVPSSEKSFTVGSIFNGTPMYDSNGNYTGDVDETVKTATVFGGKGTEVEYEGPTPDLNQSFTYPEGFNISAIPLVMPQFRFGVPLGNELMVRYMPPIDMGDFGKLNFWGLGLKHSIDQWIPYFPVHLAVQGAYQSMKVGDLVEMQSTALNAHVSKKLFKLTLYGGVGWEETILKTSYSYSYKEYDTSNDQWVDKEMDIKFDVKGDNNYRMTAGLRFAIVPFIHLHADYTISTYQIISTGIGLQF